ncbi:tandem-95 repeat protein [Vibrio parahaemolyticus]|uniref:tandem-95 repeat protein n=30 Tax=Vibrio parahaemolyticus TaxID=670 RepID=UPI003B5BF42A
MTSTDVGPLDLNVQLTQEQGSKDVTDDVLQIISAIEQGQDPSAVDEEFAPAAGENGGSSLQTSATIVRDGTELLASTSFETIGIESLGLSQTQVLALNDLFRSNLQTSADSTDKPLATTPVTLDAIEEDGGSIIITTEELLSNVDDEDKDTLSVENLIIDKGNGTLVDNGDGTWTFTPQINDDTEVSFTFDIIDDEDLVVSGSANLDILPINDAPNAENDVITTEEDTAVTIDVLVNDSDVEGDALSIQSASVPSEQGSVDIVDGKLVFTPAENFNGEATITYIVTDGDLTDEAKVTVTVTPVNDSPVAVDDTTSIQEDTAVTIDVLTNDTDVDGDKLSIESASVPKEQGTVEVVDGKLVFTPVENFNGHAEITYTVTDGQLTDEAKVTVTVNPVNDAPTIKVDAVESITEDAVSTDTVIATLEVADTDTPEDQLTVSLENNSNGYFVLVGNEVKLTQAGVDAVNNDELNLKDLTISASVSDGVNPTANDSDSLVVNRVNDAPTIKVDAVESITEDAVNTDTVVATLTVRDTDTSEDQLTVSLENNSNGYFVLVGDEVKLTQAGVDAVNNDELNLKDLTISASVSDGVNPTANDSDSLVVNRVNDAPTVENAIADQVLSEDFDAYTIDLNEVFKDSDSSLEFSVSGNNSIQISIVNGVATITPTADWNGKETITFTAKDPSGESVNQTVDFTVAPVADIVADKATVVEDTPTIIKVLGNDTFEGDGKVVSLDTNNGPSNGTVSVNPDGSVTYTPNDNYHGEDTFTYIVTSGDVSESTTVEVNVTPVNDAPVAKDDIATTQEDTAVTIDVLPNDNDIDGDKLSIQSASVPEAQGKVEIVDGKLVFTPAENFNGDAEITYTVTDGELTDEAKVTVTVNPVNDAPTIKVDAVESITENAVSTDTVVATLTVRDTDTPEDQLTVSLENNSNGYFVLVGNEVKLTQAGVDAVNNDELNLKDLTISASVSDGVNPTASDSDSLIVNRVNDAPTVENAIADQVLSEDFDAYTIDLNEVFKDSDSSLEFSVSGNNSIQISIVNGVATITPTADWNGSEALTFTATDPSGESVSQTVNFTVAPVADIEADKTTVVEDTPTIIKVLGNDTFEGKDKVVSLDAENGPKNGTVIVNSDGTVTYTPNDNYVGEDTFTYVVTSGGVSESTTVEVNVTPVNDAPVAKGDIATTQEDTAVTIDVLPNDTDVDGDTLSIQSASVPSDQGTVEIVDGKLVFTPAENFNGDAEITYTVTDGQLTDEAKVTVTVNPVNDAPTIKVDAVESITEDAVSIDTVVAALTVRDTDTPEDQLAVSLENNSNGYFVLVGDEVKLTQAGVDAVNNDELNLKDLTISASVSDGVNPTASDSDSLIVNRVNDAPTVENAIADQELSEDFATYTIDLNDAFKDSDSALNFSVTGNSNVLVSIENGIATISPTADWNGSETLTFTATDPSGESISQRVDFTVAPVVDIEADSADVVEDTPTIINVLGNDTFESTDKLVSLDAENGPKNGTVIVNNDGTVTYTPDDNYVGKDTFTYVVTSGGVSESTTVEVNVTPVNDAPVAKDDTAITDEDTPVTIDVLPNDNDIDGDKLSIQSASVPEAQGKVEIVDGKLVFTPAENFNGQAEITYTVTDGQLTDEAKVTVTVNPVNDAPTIKVDAVESITEDAVNTDTVVATLTVRDTDTPEDQLTVSLENNSNGYFVLVGNEVKLTQAGVDAVNNDELNLKDLTISASVSDGVNPTANDSDSLIVNRVNDAPTVENAIADQELSEDFATYTIDLNDAFKDSDSVLNFSVSGNSNVLVSIENGIATISPTADWNGSETLTFTATDPSGESVSQTVDFTVAPVVDIKADSTNVVEDTPTIINVLGNDTFEGKDKVVSLDADNGPKNGSVIVNNDGTVTYTPDDNYVGADSFTYIVTSGGVSESTTVNVDVTPVNDAPVAKDDIATTQEDTAVTIDVLPNDTDIDGDTLRIDSASVPSDQGTVEIVDGKLVFTPAENFNGDAEITYTVTDGELTDEAKVTVTVNPVNDVPTIKVDAVESITEDAVSTDTVVATLTVRDTDTPEDQLTVSLENNSNGYFVLVGNEVKLTQAGVDAVNNDELNLKDLTISASVSDGVNPTANDSDSLIVNRVNDAPTVENAIADQVLAEDFDVYTIDLNEVFKDSDSSLEFSVSGNDNIQISIVSGVATITPTADWNGKETITFTAKDPSGENVSQTVNFTVASVADIVADKATVVEDTPTIINVLSNDTFESTDKLVSLDADNGPKNGTVIVNNDGTVTYTPDDNYVGEDTFTYIVTSGGVSESTTVSVDVTPVNDAPVAKGDTAITDEDTPVTIDVLPNDTDIDGDKLSIQSASVPEAQGKVEIVDGKLVFTPAENFNGDAEITYTVTDGALTDQAKVTVTVNPVDDAPTIKVDAVESITEDAVSTYTVVATLTVRDTDTSEDQLTVSLENNSNGYFVLVGNEVKLTQAGVDAVNNDELNLKDLAISASVSDGVNPTASDSDSLIVNRVNDAPTVENAIADQVLSEDFDAYTIDLNEVFKDSDSSLEFSVSGNSNVLVSIENGIATISPTADWNGSEILTFKATDPSGESISQTVNFTVAPVADIVADKATVVEDTPTIIKVLGNDTFEGGDQVVSLDTNNGPANGTVSVNPDGSVTYTPNDNYHGTDSFTYIVTSGGVSESTTVNVDVTPVNDAPVAKDDIATTQEDTAVTIDALPNDTDADGDKLSIESASVPKEQGTVEVVDGKLVFTPAENFNGDAEITYTVTDGQLTDEAKVTVTVNPVNDAPTIKVDAVESITEDAVNTDTVVATLTVRDTDTPEDQLTVSLENNSNGYFVLVGNEVKLTQAGVDAVNNDELNLKDLTISASVSDGVNPTANDSDSLIVNRVNDAPTVENAIADQVLSEDFASYTIDLNDAFKDSDSALNFSVSGNSYVLVSIENGIATISPTADWNGSETLTFTATDPSGESVSQTVDFTVAPVVDIEADSADVVEDTPTIINVLGNDTFEGKDKVVSLDAENGPKNGTVIVNNDGTVTYTPDDNYVGKDTFTYVVTSGGVSESTTVEVNVTPVNDAPVAKDDIATTQEDTAVTIDVLPNDSDVDGDKLSIQSATVPEAQGKVEIVDGKLVFTPAENFNGHAEITYTVTDGELTDEAKVTVTVNPVNDAPTIKVDAVESITEDAVNTDTVVATLTVRDTDTSEDQLTVSLENNSNGYFVLVGNEVKLTQAGVDAVNNDELNLKDLTISASVSDGVNPTANDSDSLIVNRVNDAPTIKVDAVESIIEDAVNTDTVVATLTVRDTDTSEDQLTVSLENNSNGYFVLVGDEVKLTQAGVDAVNNDELNLKDLTISASVSDGVNPTANDSDSLIVNRVNDAPTVENAIADQELSEDFATYTIDLNDAFKDSDSALNFSVSGNSNVLVSIENGIATISPTADWNGSETLTFTATDPNGESVSQTVDFTVAPVVDIEADSTNVVEDTSTIINVLGNDTFEGKDKVVSLDAENGPKNGTVIVNNDGTVTYTPDDNYVGKDTFTYVVTSGGVSESTTVMVNVTPVNDKPESEDFTHVADDQLTQVVFDTDTKPLGSGDSKDHIADVEDDLKGNDLYVRITELPTSGTLFFKDSDGELHEIKEVSDTLYDKDSLYYEADNVGFLLGIKDRPNTPNGSESTSDFNNWGLSEDGGPSHSRTEHLANGASITISSDSGELAQYNRQVSHIGNGIADNDGQGIEKGETITIDLSNNPVGSVNLGLDGLGGLFDYGDDNAALITVTYLDSNNVQQTQTFEFLKPEGNFMLFQETSVGYGKDLALPEGSVITQLDFSTKNEGNWELRYVEGVPAEDSFGYVAVDSESGVSDPSTVNIVNEMLDGNVAENGPAVQSITGVTVVEGDDVTFSVSLNNATDQTVKYQVDFSAEGSSTSSQDIDLSNATFTSGVKYLGGYLIVPAGVNGFEITIPSIDDQLVESTESLVIKVGDVSGVGYIDDNDVPPTVQSNEISGLEDEAIVITLEHLGVVDSGVSVEFDTSALNGSLQVKGSDGWEAVSGSVLASDIENGLVRYVPAEHESGANVFDKDGVGNGLDTYEQIHFTVSDGNSSASGTLSIDIEPVADPIKIDLTFGPVTSVPVTLGGSWSTDEELKDLLEASNLPGLDFEHVVTQAFNNGHAGNDLMLSGDTESPLSFVGDQQAGANVDAQGSDIFVTGGGNDSIYGGIGSLDDQAETDTVVYSGKLSDYDFSYYPASDHSEVPYWIVEDSRFIDTKDVVSSTHKESGDHLYEIEQLIFQDAIIKLDNNTGEYVVLTEQQVSFELNLDLIDVDGSESFINDSVTLTGIPSGLTLEVNGKTVTENSDGSYTVDLSSEPNQTSHQLSGTITVPADYNGSLDFDVTATAGSVEVNNNTQMGADTASVSVRDYEFVSGTHGDNNIVGSDDNDVIVGDVQGLQIVEGQDYNIAFMLDTSGSMGYDVGRAVTELKTVLNTLIESASGPHSGKVNVLLTAFSTESKQVLELDLSSDNAKSQVESILDAIVKLGDGNTNYEAGFQSALNWFENADSGATNLSYFISDGRPNQATDNNVNWYSSKESVVLGVSEQQLVTLADVLPSDYRFGDTVTYNNKTVIDFRGTVYSLSTGEEMGRMLNSYEYDDFGNNVLEQANNAYSALAEFSEVRSIGIGGHLNEDSLKHFDSDGVVRTNIDVNQLAEVILGKEVSLMQGKDEISSLDGNDIIFGDAIRFDINGEQGVSALQNYVASQLGKDVALVTKEEVHHYITENQAEFEQSRYYDQADTIYGGAGNDILFGQGGNDKLFGGADNDILIGGLGSDILTGGDGEDIFKWIDVANERDTVTDFSSSEDSLDFSDLFDDLSKDEVGDLLSDLQSGSHTGDAGGYHVEVSQDGSADTNLSITKGSSTLDIHFNSASVDDITQHLIASLDSQYKDM